MKEHATRIALRELKMFLVGGVVTVAFVVIQSVASQSPRVTDTGRSPCDGKIICIKDAK